MFFHGVRAEGSTSIISYAKVAKYLNKGCQGFLASVVLVDRTSCSDPGNEKVVSKFPNFFPEDLSGLPPKR